MFRRLIIQTVLIESFVLLGMISCDNGNPLVVQEANTVADVDGNIYQTIKIGNQVWTTENLRTTRLNDGSIIPLAKSDSSWSMRATPGYCFLNNTTNADSIMKFGALYNWYVVNTHILAPAGWHVPTDSDWTTLKNYLISSGFNWDGTTTGNKIAKSLSAKTDWNVSGHIGSELSKNNKSGFSALPGGLRADGSRPFGIYPPDAKFYSQGYEAIWWSSSSIGTGSGVARHLENLYEDLEESSYGASNGFSIRLIRD